MLTAQDDLIGHQTPSPFAKSGAGDIRFTERYWYTAHPVDGTELLLDVGLGYYPNRNVMDGFAGVTVGRRQHNFRASRRLGTRPLDTSVGPLKIEIVEGMKLHRLTLAENPSGISFSLEFEASFPPAQEKQNFRERNGIVEEDLARVSQFGRWRGWIVVDGRRNDVDPSCGGDSAIARGGCVLKCGRTKPSPRSRRIGTSSGPGPCFNSSSRLFRSS